jgi:hypothetical protein
MTAIASSIGPGPVRFMYENMQSATEALTTAVASAVAQVQGIQPRKVRTLRSNLKSFMLDSAASGWNGEGVPDIAMRLTDTAVDRHIRGRLGQGDPTRSLQNRRASLRQIQKALGHRARRRGPSSTGSTTGLNHLEPLIDLIRRGVTLPELHACFLELRASNPQLPGQLNTILLKAPVRAALQERPFDRVQSSDLWINVAMATARIPEGKGWRAVTGEDLNRGSSPRKRKSNRAVKREAAARAAERDARENFHDLSQPTWRQWEALPEDVRTSLLAYKPRKTDLSRWESIRPVFLRLMSLKTDRNTRVLNNTAAHLSPYLLWRLSSRPEPSSAPLGLHEVGAIDEIEGWLAHQLQQGRPESSLATARSELRNVIKRLNPEAAPVRLSGLRTPVPYTGAQMRAFIGLAMFQPDQLVQKHACAVLALAGGAGLSAKEVSAVRRCDVTRIELMNGADWTYQVEVTGPNPGKVPVHRALRDCLDQALAIHAKQHPPRKRASMDSAIEPGWTKELLPKSDRSKPADLMTRAAIADRSRLDMQAHSLRNTWLVQMMQAPISLPELLHVAGLTTASSLADLRPYCEPVDPARLALLMCHYAEAGELL